MHELGLCESIMDAVLTRAAGRQVSGVRVRVGVLQRVWKPAFDQAFEMIASGTLAEGARVDLVVLPVRSTCRTCGAQAELQDVPIVCAACGGADVDWQGGDELMLESITVQTEPVAAS